MKKTSKLFGAVALSAALAVGCAMPAFAETTGSNTGSATDDVQFDGIAADGNGTVTNTDNANSTVVNVSTYTSQLSVTVPLKLPVVLDRAGGMGKTPTNYFIQNNSGPDIEVKSAAYSILDEGTNKADWNFGSSDDHIAVDAAASRLSGTSSAPVNPAAGTMMMSFVPADTSFGTTEWYTKGGSASSGKTQEGTAVIEWTVPGTATKPGTGADATAARKCTITVKASSSVLAKEASDLDLAGIIYTVGLSEATA